MPALSPAEAAAAEYKALLREQLAIQLESAAALREAKPHLEALALQKTRENDLHQRDLDANSNERKTSAAERSQWRQALTAFGEGACKVLDSRWSTIGMGLLFLAQFVYFQLGWTDKPPALPVSIPAHTPAPASSEDP